MRNPGCTHHQDAASTVSSSEDQPDGSTLYVEFDMQACAQEYQAGISAEAPCESFFVDASSELIATVHPSAAPPSQNYHSTTAQLPLEDSSGATVETKSVIDTGAASCGMDADYRRKHFPNAAVRPSRRRFLDAQKQVMQLEGEMDLYVWIGDLRLLTVAYIFKNLGAQFLLGNNATTRHGLTISNYRGILYSEMPYATKDSQTAIASVRTGAATCSLCEEDCECSLKGACLTCDLDNSEFLLRNSKGTTRQVPFEPVDAGTAAAETTDEDPVRLRTFAHSSFTTTIRPGVKARIRLDYDKLYHGPAATAELTLMPSFERWLKDHHCICHTSLYHSTLNRHAYTTIINNGDDPVTLYGNHKVATVEVSHETPTVNIVTDAPERVSFKLNYDPLASGLKWERMTTPPKETEVECTNGCYRQLEGRELVHEGLAAALAGKTNFELSEWLRFKIPKTRLTLATHVKATDGHYYRPVEELPFAESGRPRNRDDLIALGFSLEDAIDPTSELVDGKHKPLPEEQKTRLYELALRYWYVWSRDARTPELSWLVVLEIPTAAHKTLQQQSDAIKQARINEENARKYARLNSSKFGVVEASTATEPKYAWLIHGSLESAAYMRKHGHGLPWRHKYKVLEVRPHAVKLEIPKDGSVPIINEWQLRRRVAPAHPGEHTPGKAAPIITESGILIPTADPSFNPGLITSPPSKESAAPTGEQDYATDDEVYEIDKVHHAERVGNHFKIYLLWKTGEITWRWYHTLRKETMNEELTKEMREAVSAEIARRRITNPSGDTSGETDSRDEMPPPIDTEIEGAPPPTIELGRGKRVRNPAQHYNASTFLVDDFSSILYASMILA